MVIVTIYGFRVTSVYQCPQLDPCCTWIESREFATVPPYITKMLREFFFPLVFRKQKIFFLNHLHASYTFYTYRTVRYSKWGRKLRDHFGAPPVTFISYLIGYTCKHLEVHDAKRNTTKNQIRHILGFLLFYSCLLMAGVVESMIDVGYKTNNNRVI